MLLELIEIIEKRGRHINNRKLVIGIDNCTAYGEIAKKVMKPNSYTNDTGIEIAQIRSLLQRIKFEIEFILMRGYQVINRPFQLMPVHHLLRECIEEARKLRENIEEEELETNIKFLRRYAVKVKGRITNASIKEVVQKVDAIETEKEYIKEKIGYNAEYVDLEARNAFPINKVTSSIIKYASRYNQYRLRDKIMNNNMINSDCLRYS